MLSAKVREASGIPDELSGRATDPPKLVGFTFRAADLRGAEDFEIGDRSAEGRNPGE